MKFIKRPIALPSNYRFFYQISILLLVLKLCCAKNVGASTLKFQLLAWTLRDDDGCNSLMKVTKLKDKKCNFNFWALDPALNRAIEFAVADGFLILKNEKFISAPKGDALLSYILETDVFMLINMQKLPGNRGNQHRKVFTPMCVIIRHFAGVTLDVTDGIYCRN